MSDPGFWVSVGGKGGGRKRECPCGCFCAQVRFLPPCPMRAVGGVSRSGTYVPVFVRVRVCQCGGTFYQCGVPACAPGSLFGSRCWRNLDLGSHPRVSGSPCGRGVQPPGPAGLSSCSGGLRPLVELCVEPGVLCGRCLGVAVPLRVVPSPTGLPSKRGRER